MDSEQVAPSTVSLVQPSDEDFALELTDRCARPHCRREFKRSTGLGRRRQYCSDTCRGNAEREYKQAKAVVTQYERMLRDARVDVAAFGRSNDEYVVVSESDHNAAFEAARRSWLVARGAAKFARPGDEQVLEVLLSLVDDAALLFEYDPAE